MQGGCAKQRSVETHHCVQTHIHIVRACAHIHAPIPGTFLAELSIQGSSELCVYFFFLIIIIFNTKGYAGKSLFSALPVNDF